MTSMEMVKVSGSLEYPFLVIAKNDDFQLKGTAVVRVEAPAVARSRAPMHLVVVLALSSSSSRSAPPPRSLDLLKKAMKSIIDHLDQGDILSIVASTNDKKNVAHTANTEISSMETRNNAKTMVDNLVVRGHTSFKSVFDKATEILGTRSDMTHRSFIIFISDGRDDSIKSNRNYAIKYPVHAFGLDQAHSPEQLFSIAKKSNGTYSSITKDHSSKIMEAFAICLAGFKSVVAVDTSVQISEKLSKLIKNWEITGIDSGGIRKDEGSNKVVLGVLYAGEVKDLIIHIKCTVKKTTGFQSIELVTATVNYKSAQGKEIKPEICTLEVKVCATSFAKECTMEPTPFPMVLQQKIRLEVLGLMRKFLESCKKQIHIDLRTTWEEFKKTNKFWKDAQRVGLDDLLRRVESEIEAMASCLKLGSELGCTYSWVSSYEMQRATTSVLPATVFVTPAMKKMVLEVPRQVSQRTPF